MNELESGFRAHWRGYLIGIVAALLAFYYLFLRKVPGTATAPAKSGAGAGYLIQPGTTSGGSVDTGSGGADATAQLQDFLKQATDSLTQLSASQVAALQSASQQQLANMTAAQQAAQQAAASQLAQEQTLAQQIMSMLKSQGTVPSGAGGTVTDAQATQWAQNLGIPAGWGIQYRNDNGGLAPDIPTLNAWLDAKGYRDPATGKLNFGGAPAKAAGPDVAGWAASLGVPVSEGQAFVQSVGRLPGSLQEWVSFRNAHGWSN